MRVIQAEEIKKAVKKLFLDCNYYIGEDIKSALYGALEIETSDVSKNVLSQIIENNKIAADEEIPICQDTGMAVLFVEYGDKVIVEGGGFEESVQDGVREAYIDGSLRKSIVSDPVFDRKNTLDNTHAVIHTKITKGENIKITAGAKGFGSENMSAIKMLSPSDGLEGIKKFVLDTVRSAGPNPCPPIVVGVGIGGTFEACATLSKKATLSDIDTYNSDERYGNLEKELCEEINKMGFGPAGLGGKTTALKVNILTMPTHIAGLPVAVNICCHAARHKEIVL